MPLIPRIPLTFWAQAVSRAQPLALGQFARFQCSLEFEICPVSTFWSNGVGALVSEIWQVCILHNCLLAIRCRLRHHQDLLNSTRMFKLEIDDVSP